MKHYKKSIFALVYFIVINSTFLYAQRVGYLRIIDNSNKNNDYKDCQYNRFDDLLIRKMNQNEINVVDFNFSQIENLKLGISLQSGTLRLPTNGYFEDFFGKSEKQKRNFRKKMDVDYLIYCAFDWESSQEKFMSQLVCGTDFIRKYSVYASKYFLKFKILNLNDYSTNDLIYKDFHSKDSDLSVENFNTNTNVDNWVKDILDIIQKSKTTNKSNNEEIESKSNSAKINNNSFSNRNNFSNPRIMVLPKKIEENNYKNGEYYLNKEEKMIIASLKKVLEDNKIKTIGFESVIKNISERRLLQSGTKVDLKTLILESNEADFYVEFENLSVVEETKIKSTDQSKSQPINDKDKELMDLYGYDTRENASKPNTDSENCLKSFDFKIRNYATSEDIASDLQEINTCGSVDEYKKFANKILNYGAISKIKDEFQYLIENGIKISVFFTFSEASNKKFDDKIQGGIRISQHIEKCIKDNAFNGNFIIGGVVNNYISFPQVAIPFRDKNNGQIYTTFQFSNVIRDYIENYLEVKEVTVTGSSINFILN
jgi:hypothetical protein